MTSPAENLFCEKCHLTLPAGWHRYDAPVPKSDVLAYATRTGGGDYPPQIVISGEGRPMTMRSFRSKAPRIMRYRAEARGYDPVGEPRWVTVGGHPAYQATYRYGADGPTRMVTELLTLDRVRVGTLLTWWAVGKGILVPATPVLIQFDTTEDRHVDDLPDLQFMLESWNWHAPKPPGLFRRFLRGGLPVLWFDRRPDRGGQGQRRMRTSWRFWLGVFFVLEGAISLTKSPGHPSNLGWAVLGFIVGAALIIWAKKRATSW